MEVCVGAAELGAAEPIESVEPAPTDSAESLVDSAEDGSGSLGSCSVIVSLVQLELRGQTYHTWDEDLTKCSPARRIGVTKKPRTMGTARGGSCCCSH